MKQNLPIRSELKSKRLQQVESIDESCWAFMKVLREHNNTRKIYEIDPYVEVYQFRENMYGLLAENADGMGDAWTYLIIGPQKAMLIDTNFGIGNLKGLVDLITGNMPLIVVNTHTHPDHAMGNCQFDKVYIHEYGVTQLEKMKSPDLWDYLFDESGRPIWLEFDRKDIIAYKDYEVVGCPDGYIFELGDGYEVELIHVPGHNPEHSFFLDKKNRIIYAGDGIVSMRVGLMAKPGTPYSEHANIIEFRDALKKVMDRRDEFDHVFPGHFICDLESSVIENMYRAANEAIEKPDSYNFETKHRSGEKRKVKYVDGLGTLMYDDSVLENCK